VLVVALHRDDFILELAFDGGLVGQAVRTLTESVLRFAADAVHLAQHLGGQTHHARRLGGVQGQVRVRINTVHHANVAHVLHTAYDEYVAVAGLDGLHGSVQGAHGGTAQAADSLTGAGVRNLGHQRRHARDVPALLQGLVDAAPDHVLDFSRVDLAVALQQFADQVRGHGLGAGVAVHAALGTTHRGTTEVDDHCISRIQAHISTLALFAARLTEELLALGGHFTKLGGRVVQRAQVGIFVSQGDEFGYTDRIDVTQRTTAEGREADTVDQAHIGLGCGVDDAVFQATNGFQAQRDHQGVDDVCIGDFTPLVHDRRQ